MSRVKMTCGRVSQILRDVSKVQGSNAWLCSIGRTIEKREDEVKETGKDKRQNGRIMPTYSFASSSSQRDADSFLTIFQSRHDSLDAF